MFHKSILLFPAIALLLCGCGPGTATHEDMDPGEAGEREKIPSPLSASPTSPTRPASASSTPTARPARSCCPRRWAPASPSSISTTTAGRICCSSTPAPGPATSSRPAAPTLALYRNNGKDGNVRRRDGASGLDVTMYGMGVDGRRLRQRRLARRVHHRRRRQPPVPQRGRRQAASGRDRQGRRRRAGRLADERRRRFPQAGTSRSTGPPRPPGSTTTATAGSTCSSATTSPGRRPTTCSIELRCERQRPGLRPADRLRRQPVLPLPQQGDGTFEDVSRRPASRSSSSWPRPRRPAAAGRQVAGRDRLRRGRRRLAATSSSPTTRCATSSSTTSPAGRQAFEEIGLPTGVAYAEGAARGAMGIDWGEYRPGKCAAAHRQLRQRADHVLRLDNPKRLVFADAAPVRGPGRAEPAAAQVRHLLLRLRPRRPARPADLPTATWSRRSPRCSRADATASRRSCSGTPASRRALRAGDGQDAAGPDLFQPLVGRGCAFADIDGDGDLDVVLTDNGGPARLLRNEGGSGNHWLRLVLEGDGSALQPQRHRRPRHGGGRRPGAAPRGDERAAAT